MQTLDVDGKQVRVHRQGTGRPLVYFHSAAGEVGPIEFFAELASAGYEVIVPELPGFGHTEPALEWRKLEDVLFHQRRVLDTLGLDRVTLVGSSVGGWLAAEVAVWFPERVEALVLISAAGLRLEEAPIADLFVGPGSDQETSMRQANPHGIDMMAALAPVFGDADMDAITLHFLRATTALARLGWDPYMHDPRLPARLRSLDVPTLVVWGADDGVVPLAHAHAYADAIAGARLEVLDHCGHGPILEHPAKVASLIAELAAAPAPA